MVVVGVVLTTTITITTSRQRHEAMVTWSEVGWLDAVTQTRRHAGSQGRVSTPLQKDR